MFPTQPGNPDLRWETVETIDASVEMGIVERPRVCGARVVQQDGQDVLMNVELPSHTGFNNRSVNAGQVLNRGVELGITSNNLPSTSELQWKTTLNYAYNYNELVSTGDFTEDAISGGTNDSRAVTGAPLTTYFLVPSAMDPESGLPVYIDINGNETFEYNLEDRQAVGDGLPTTWGLRNEITFRNWTFSSQFTAAFGAKIWDSSAKRQLGVVTDWNMRTDLFDRWRQPGDIASFPRLTLDETTYGLPAGFPWWNTSLFMYDASYVRLRNASISYRVPASKGNITLRLSGNNLFVLTNFIGLDPELTRDFENRQDRNFWRCQLPHRASRALCHLCHQRQLLDRHEDHHHPPHGTCRSGHDLRRLPLALRSTSTSTSSQRTALETPDDLQALLVSCYDVLANLTTETFNS